MALSGHIGEPWHTWTPEKREMSYPVLPIVWVKNTSEEARNCLSLLGKHLLSTSLGTCLESDVVSYLQPLLRMELCTCAVWQGTWPTWCKSLGHTCHHMSHSTSTMLQHKVRPDFKLNVIRLANNFNQSYFPYTSVMCASATY